LDTASAVVERHSPPRIGGIRHPNGQACGFRTLDEVRRLLVVSEHRHTVWAFSVKHPLIPNLLGRRSRCHVNRVRRTSDRVLFGPSVRQAIGARCVSVDQQRDRALSVRPVQSIKLSSSF
jgi:hypothetical protein